MRYKLLKPFYFSPTQENFGLPPLPPGTIIELSEQDAEAGLAQGMLEATEICEDLEKESQEIMKESFVGCECCDDQTKEDNAKSKRLMQNLFGAPEHACRFNDGDQRCGCYEEGVKAALDFVKGKEIAAALKFLIK